MRRLINLAYPNDLTRSSNKFEILRHKDGQQDVIFTDLPAKEFMKDDTFELRIRLRDFRDMEVLMCAVRALRRYGLRKNDIDAYIPYMLGARSDRKFKKGGDSYLVDVIAPCLNMLGFDNVLVYDIHSDVADACIHNLGNGNMAFFMINQIIEKNAINKDNYTLLCPDAGAQKRTYELAELLGYEHDIAFAYKHRNLKDNSLSSIRLDNDISGFTKDDNIFLVDDICDGGRTHIGLAQKVRPLMNGGTLNMVIPHFIGSYGLDVIAPWFDNIYCTNSYSDFDVPEQFKDKFHQISVI